MAGAVSFRNVGKEYRGARAYRSLREDITAPFKGSRPRPPVRALEDVSFEIGSGESVAMLGLNGAGKTTALKLLCRIAFPSTGRIAVMGRVGALIEVGTGMHPELSGRENVRLYGRIMGLSKRDIERRFDEIVEFAGVESAIDRQVKQYSSGMQLRLGFSVAAHLEPDIFVVDEAISVGDAGFQNRCVERMTKLSREGRTLIFVSHDLHAVETLCQRGLLLDKGRLVADGSSADIVRAYFEAVHDVHTEGGDESVIEGDGLTIEKVGILDEFGHASAEVTAYRPMTVRMHYHAHRRIPNPFFSVGISDGSPRPFIVASMLMDGESPEYIEGTGVIECQFLALPLHARTFEVWGSVRGEAAYGDIIDWQRFCVFRVRRDAAEERKGAITVAMGAPIRVPYRWDTGP